MPSNVGLLIGRWLVATVVVAFLSAASSAASPVSRDTLVPTLKTEMKDVAAGVPGVVVLVVTATPSNWRADTRTSRRRHPCTRAIASGSEV